MRFKSIQPKFWPFTLRTPAQTVVRDADELMQIWGEGAYAVAGTMSWREDTGLIHTSMPGHWSRVQREIGYRTGRRDSSIDADPTAGTSPARVLM